MPVKYLFKEDAVLLYPKDTDPQQVGQELDRIAQTNNGELTPALVVENARGRRNPLHQLFEWDNREAAEQWRLSQARQLIRSIKIEDDEAESGWRHNWISIKLAGEPRSYKTADKIAGSFDLQVACLMAAKRDLNAFRKRYQQLKEICQAVGEAEAKIDSQLSSITDSQRVSA